MKTAESFALGSRMSGFFQIVSATPMKLAPVTAATSGRGSSVMAAPTATATAILHMNANAMPRTTDAERYRVASTPVVYSSLSPTISATKTAP